MPVRCPAGRLRTVRWRFSRKDMDPWTSRCGRGAFSAQPSPRSAGGRVLPESRGSLRRLAGEGLSTGTSGPRPGLGARNRLRFCALSVRWPFFGRWRSRVSPENRERHPPLSAGDSGSPFDRLHQLRILRARRASTYSEDDIFFDLGHIENRRRDVFQNGPQIALARFRGTVSAPIRACQAREGAS